MTTDAEDGGYPTSHISTDLTSIDGGNNETDKRENGPQERVEEPGEGMEMTFYIKLE